MPRFLHVGCGPARKAQTTSGFNRPEWDEVRLDIDPRVEPDILGSLTDLSAVADGSMDALFSSHSLEHVYPHEVAVALSEFRRALADDGFLIVTCPDLQSLAELIAQDGLTEPAYMSEAGPITPLDSLYGLRSALAAGNLHMAHRTGFTRRTLIEALHTAGFGSVAALQRKAAFDLWAVGTKTHQPRERMEALVRDHFPGQATPA